MYVWSAYFGVYMELWVYFMNYVKFSAYPHLELMIYYIVLLLYYYIVVNIYSYYYYIVVNIYSYYYYIVVNIYSSFVLQEHNFRICFFFVIYFCFLIFCHDYEQGLARNVDQ